MLPKSVLSPSRRAAISRAQVRRVSEQKRHDCPCWRAEIQFGNSGMKTRALPGLLSFNGDFVDTAGFLGLQGLFVTLGAALVFGARRRTIADNNPASSRERTMT
jgi:hypothetical protein